MTKRTALKDSQLLAACISRSEQACQFTDSKLARERREVTEYYQGALPAKTHEGQSDYRDMALYNGVEAMKAQLLETFAAGSNIASFPPMGPGDEPRARVATAYVEHQFFRQNDGLELMADVIHDGLTARVGVLKFSWEKNEQLEDHEFAGATYDQLEAEAQREDVHEIEHEEGPDGLHSGRIAYKKDHGRVAIEAIPPEEFIVETRVKDLRRARYVAHRTIKTLGELVEDGYKPSLVYSIAGDTDDLDMNEESQARRRDTHDGNLWGRNDDSPDAASREVTVYESYIRIDMKGVGTQQLWRVVHAGSTLLEKQEVDRLPFKVFRPLPVSHTFWGSNYAEKIIQIAKVRTVIMRAILDATVRNVTQRYMVVKGGVTNPRELIDNRPGGIVNVSRPDAIQPLPLPQLPPQIFQVMDRADADREDVTGISRLSQGLSKDAVSQQNSQGLVEALTTNSQVRQTVVAKLFANQIVREAYLEIYQLGIENDTAERFLEVAGEQVPVTPAQWPQRSDVHLDLELAYGAREKKVAELFAFHKEMSADPKMGRIYDEAAAYRTVKRALEVKGIKDTQTFLNDPSKLGPPQPDPQVMAELEKLKVEIDVTKRKQDLAERKSDHELKLAELEAGIKMQLDQIKMQIEQNEDRRKDELAASKIDIDTAEMELTAAQFASPDVERKATAIMSPNA